MVDEELERVTRLLLRQFFLRDAVLSLPNATRVDPACSLTLRSSSSRATSCTWRSSRRTSSGPKHLAQQRSLHAELQKVTSGNTPFSHAAQAFPKHSALYCRCSASGSASKEKAVKRLLCVFLQTVKKTGPAARSRRTGAQTRRRSGRGCAAARTQS